MSDAASEHRWMRRARAAFEGRSEGGMFWVSASAFPEGVLHYQLGLADVRVGEVVWEPWTAVSLDR